MLRRRFPKLFEILESAAIHLTGIVLLSPHLTDENHAELLERARFRTKREIQKLIAEVAPRPDVPAIIEPLGLKRGIGSATWSAYMDSLRGPVRNLPAGNGPAEAPAPPMASAPEACANDLSAPARVAEGDISPPEVSARADSARTAATSRLKFGDAFGNAMEDSAPSSTRAASGAANARGSSFITAIRSAVEDLRRSEIFFSRAAPIMRSRRNESLGGTIWRAALKSGSCWLFRPLEANRRRTAAPSIGKSPDPRSRRSRTPIAVRNQTAIIVPCTAVGTMNCGWT